MHASQGDAIQFMIRGLQGQSWRGVTAKVAVLCMEATWSSGQYVGCCCTCHGERCQPAQGGIFWLMFRGPWAQSQGRVLTKAAVFCMKGQVRLPSPPPNATYKMTFFPLLPTILETRPRDPQSTRCDGQSCSKHCELPHPLLLNRPTSSINVPKHNGYADGRPRLSTILPTWEWPWRDLRVVESSSTHTIIQLATITATAI